MVQNRVIETSSLVPILKEINPVLLPISYVSTSILILSYHLRQDLTTNSYLSSFPTKTKYSFAICTMHMTPTSHYSWLNLRNNIS
jgi:hypothetical protein